MDDPKDQHDPVLVEHVVHDAVVAHAQPVEGVAHALDRLDPLSCDPTAGRHVDREPLERTTDAGTHLRGELLVDADR